MEEIQLQVGKEQSINIDDYIISFNFDPFNHEWHYNMDNQEGENILVNVVLRVNQFPLRKIADRMEYPQLCLMDKEPDNTNEINPLLDFGDRLGLFQLGV